VNLVDTLSALKGAHQFKFGVDYRRLSPVFDFTHYSQQSAFGGVNGARSTVDVRGFGAAGPNNTLFLINGRQSMDPQSGGSLRERYQQAVAGA